MATVAFGSALLIVQRRQQLHMLHDRSHCVHCTQTSVVSLLFLSLSNSYLSDKTSFEFNNMCLVPVGMFCDHNHWQFRITGAAVWTQTWLGMIQSEQD